MTYKNALNYLYQQLPMFQRIGSAAYKPSLQNTIELCKAIGNPQNSLNFIHIAGTNGKGSTSHMIASVFQVAGYNTGLYTSPHLIDFRERIKVNGEMISKRHVSVFVEKHLPVFEKIKPSFFEMTVALAFDYFKKKKTDIIILETGMGGRLDSTNVVVPLLSVITNISPDHQQFLGDTLPKIAGEKAGIIKPGIPVLIGQHQIETDNVVISKANSNNSKIVFAQNKVLSAINTKNGLIDDITLKSNFLKENIVFKPALKSLYQKLNITTATAAVLMMRDMGWSISDKHIKTGISQTIKLTGLRGRWEILKKKPLTIADTGHNIDGIKQVKLQLSKTKYQKIHWILGMVSDKDIDKILSILPKNAQYYFCRSKIPRALPENVLYEKAILHGLKGDVYSSVKSAYRNALKMATDNDLVLVAGSTFTVAEVLQ